jgi:hypothetical protein
MTPERFISEHIQEGVRSGRVDVLSALEGLIAERGDGIVNIVLRGNLVHGR